MWLVGFDLARRYLRNCPLEEAPRCLTDWVDGSLVPESLEASWSELEKANDRGGGVGGFQSGQISSVLYCSCCIK